MEDINRYLILTENDGRYKVSANTWQEALVKYFKYCGGCGGITYLDFSKLIETRVPHDSIDLFNYLQMHEDDIETFVKIDEEFVSHNIIDIEEDK